MRKKAIMMVLISVILTISTNGCAKREPQTKELIIPGTGACEDILRKLAEAFNEKNKGFKVMVPPSIGSGGGVKAAGNEECALARVARQIKDKEAHFGLDYLVFAKDIVGFGVGSDVKVDNLTAKQLADIFSGKITKWNQVGGEDVFIEVLTREKGDSSLSVIEKHIEEFSDLKFKEGAKCLYHDYEMVEMLNKFSKSIGFLTSSSAKNSDIPIRMISVNGVKPTKQNIISGKYPLSCEYAFVYKKKNPNKSVKVFLDFVFSEEGEKFLEKNGMIAIERR